MKEMIKQVMNIAREPHSPFAGLWYSRLRTSPVTPSPQAINNMQTTVSTGFPNHIQPMAISGMAESGNHTSAIEFVVRPEPPTPLKVPGLNNLAAQSKSTNPAERNIGHQPELNRYTASR